MTEVEKAFDVRRVVEGEVQRLIDIFLNPVTSKNAIGIISAYKNEGMPCDAFICAINLSAFDDRPALRDALDRFRDAQLLVIHNENEGGSESSMTPHEQLIDFQRADHPLRQFLTEYFDLTPEEIAQTIFSYDETDHSVSISFDFGEGLQNTPARTAKLLKLLRVSGRN